MTDDWTRGILRPVDKRVRDLKAIGYLVSLAIWGVLGIICIWFGIQMFGKAYIWISILLGG